MADEEAGDQDEQNDIVDLENYTANRRSPNKRGKATEEDGKLLTSRGNPRESVVAGASTLKTRSIRNPDFIR